MLTMQRLEALVQERLGGDNARLLKLFETRDVFELLKAGAPDSDWYHFEPKTFDGRYLIETESGFRTYQQDRGAKGEYAILRRCGRRHSCCLGDCFRAKQPTALGPKQPYTPAFPPPERGHSSVERSLFGDARPA